MFDFWLTMGVIATDSTFLTSLGTIIPFTKATASITVNGTTTSLKAPGTFDDNGVAVAALRTTLQTQLNNRFPGANITVSLYTAGKLTQLMTVDGATVNSVLKNDLGPAFADAFKNAGNPPLGYRDVAYIGACLIDDGLIQAMSTKAVSPQDIFFVSPVSSPQWKLVVALIADNRFTTANQTLSPTATWDFGCFQRFIFYPKFQMIAN
jgi:hypothetical protein